MPKPLTDQMAFPWPGNDVPCIFYDGTNDVAVKAWIDPAQFTFVSRNPTTKIMHYDIVSGGDVDVYPGYWYQNNRADGPQEDAGFFAMYRIGGPTALMSNITMNALEVGSVKLPLLALGVPSAPQVITLSGDMGSSTYSVKLIPGSTLLGTSTVNITSKTSTTVTLTVTASGLISAGATLTLVCVR